MRPQPERRERGRWRWPGWVERLTLSSGPDVMALLVAQGEVSVKALEAFESWSKAATGAANVGAAATVGAAANVGAAATGTDSARQVRDLEHAADDARHALVAALRSSLATPIGQEDLFVLSERCDRVVNRAKDIVAEAELLHWSPDAHAAAMAQQLHHGITSVSDGFKTLTARGDATAQAALDATHCVRAVEHEYRRSMAGLEPQSDLREVLDAREMYRYYARAAEALEGLADRLWYAVLAEP